ncbi:MAG: trigger factor [Candidatus Magasanikbacteria bacterium RIFCSPHIGHO2_02_FULL_47_14]|uniref:Trigger factor n=1 Tax=Candidatus Magasanikbacteria bacterium RIFCSPHIGHO2_02_FULL_47_14 TaxID=1798680 RepID=A0A1F6M4J5_9BACT|nr:MAG: trigger factor [Candidatus Magasanikbacteria bacterium RIFCSPHIGHO2_02_FULL_47_14]
MNYTSKKLPQSQVELTITVPAEEYKPFMEKAAQRISARVATKGFRKGHAPYDVIAREVGEMNILQEAIEPIVQKTYVEALQQEKLEVLGMPKVNVEKVAPRNDFVYTAVVALVPKIKLPKIEDIKVKKVVKKVEDKDIKETVDAIRGMQAKEVIKSGKAEGTDKLVLDMDMFLDNVPVDGGQAKDYQVYLSEDHYIPGFNEHVTGLKKGDEKKFQLDFPKNHYQKHLAGKTVDFTVNVKDVYERQLPEMDADFAKRLGQESVEKVQELIKSNLYEEAKRKADQSAEVEILEKLIEKTTFDEIPELVIDSEKHRMFYELKRDLDKNGISIEQYLQDIKKKEDELYKDFTDQATKRGKAALISRQVAIEQNLKATDEELEKEIEIIKGSYQGNEEALENLKRPEVRDSIAMTVQNKKVIDWLKEKILEKEEK